MSKRKATVGKNSMTTKEAMASARAAGNKRKAVVGGTGIMPSVSMYKAGIDTSPNATAMKASKGSLADRGRSEVSNVGSLAGRGNSEVSNTGNMAGMAKSDKPYESSLPKAQSDAKMSQIAEALAPYKQKSLERITKLQELTQAIQNATSMEEINAINEQIRAFQLENSKGE